MARTDLSTAKVGERIFFAHWATPFTVQARSARFIIATQAYSRRGQEPTVRYTVIDLEEGVRGPDNLIFCMGYETREQCEERLADLKTGLAEVSHRHRMPLDVVGIREAKG